MRITGGQNHRNTSLDLMRGIAAFMVVSSHYFNRTAGGAMTAVRVGSPNWFFILLMASFAAPAVNLFVLLSGFLGGSRTHVSLKKPVLLLLAVSGYRLLGRIVSQICGLKTFSIASLIKAAVPLNYFVILYIAVYLLSPYINIALKVLNDDQFKRFVLLLLLLFSVWNTIPDLLLGITGTAESEVLGYSTVAMNGSGGGIH